MIIMFVQQAKYNIFAYLRKKSSVHEKYSGCQSCRKSIKIVKIILTNLSKPGKTCKINFISGRIVILIS